MTLLAMDRSIGLILLLVSVVAQPGLDDSPRSPSLAKQLVAALTEQKLEAIAAPDPDDSNLFVAGLLVGSSQLLVVSAQPSTPSVLEARLVHKQYRDAYLDLQGSPLRERLWFVQDMDADGLCLRRGQVADILYHANERPKIFEGDWDKHREPYRSEFLSADRRYSRLLEILLFRATR